LFAASSSKATFYRVAAWFCRSFEANAAYLLKFGKLVDRPVKIGRFPLMQLPVSVHWHHSVGQRKFARPIEYAA
jgi:hypothetical protein